MTAAFHVDVDDTRVIEMVDAVLRRLAPSGLRVFLRADVAPVLERTTVNRFRSEGDAVVGKWHPLHAVTARIRGSRGYGPWHPINVRTQQLLYFASGTYTVQGVGAGGASLTMPGPASGQLAKKFRTAQQGDPATNTVARPVVAISGSDRIDISQAFLDFVRGGGA